MEIRDIFRAKGLTENGTRDIFNLAPGTKLIEASAYLTEKKIGLAAIFNDDETLSGVLSERDIVRAIGTKGNAALEDEVRLHMTRDVKTCKPSDHPFEVIELMSNGGFRHIPVENDQKIIGLLSSRDIFKYITDNANPQEQAELWTKISWL